MSDKWLSDDELNNILGNNSEDEEAGSGEDIIDQLLGEKGNNDKTNPLIGDEDEETNESVEQVEVLPVTLESFSENGGGKEGEPIPGFQTLYDVPLDIRVLLGSAEKTIEEILDLKIDSVVKLSKIAGEPVEIIVGNQLIAKGEPIILDDKFGVLITEIISPQERVRTVENKLKKQKRN